MSRIWKWGAYPGLSSWTQCNHLDDGREAGGLERLELKTGVMQARAKKCGQALEARKSKEWLLHWSLPKEYSPANTFLISDLQNCEIINWCCFKPLNLWWYFYSRNRKLNTPNTQFGFWLFSKLFWLLCPALFSLASEHLSGQLSFSLAPWNSGLVAGYFLAVGIPQALERYRVSGHVGLQFTGKMSWSPQPWGQSGRSTFFPSRWCALEVDAEMFPWKST